MCENPPLVRPFALSQQIHGFLREWYSVCMPSLHLVWMEEYVMASQIHL